MVSLFCVLNVFHIIDISGGIPDSEEPDPLFPAAHMRDLLSGLSGA